MLKVNNNVTVKINKFISKVFSSFDNTAISKWLYVWSNEPLEKLSAERWNWISFHFFSVVRRSRKKAQAHLLSHHMHNRNASVDSDTMLWHVIILEFFNFGIDDFFLISGVFPYNTIYDYSKCEISLQEKRAFKLR